MISFLSVLTSVKDYVEITHKLLEADSTLFQIKNYDEIGSLLTFFVISLKDFFINFFTLNWIKNFWSLPIIVPDIASAMISEISILDGSFHNAFNFLETPLAYGQQNSLLYGGEKFFIGFLNSLFLVLPTSAAHIITLRRFIMQGVEIGYLAGLGTIFGNLLWLSAIIFGWRFLVIPWLSFDILRYLVGFILLVKYLWDSTKERRVVIEDVNKLKIFLLNFLLAFTEQTCIYPFLSNISISPEGSLLETFPAETFQQFIFIHGAYLFGIFVGCYSLLLFSCWFWEYPAFSIYLWIQTKSNYRFTTSFYYKNVNSFLTYLTVLGAISSIPYYGLDYTITKQLGFVPQDRLLTEKPSLQNQSEYERLVPETSFLNIQPTNINLRVRDGQRSRRERWRQTFIKYEGFDVSLYDQGVYDFLTIEDLNYGFDRFWFKRKTRYHSTQYRLLPISWGRTIKKQLLQPSKEAKRNDFFRLLFEQYYHPSFHKIQNSTFLLRSRRITESGTKGNESVSIKLPLDIKSTSLPPRFSLWEQGAAIEPQRGQGLPLVKENILDKNKSFININNKYSLGNKTRTEFSALRKFVRKFNTRIKTSEIDFNLINLSDKKNLLHNNELTKMVYSKRWKQLYSNIWRGSTKIESKMNLTNHFRNLSRKIFLQSQNIKKQLNIFSKKENQYNSLQKLSKKSINKKQEKNEIVLLSENFKRTLAREKLSKKDRQILRYRTFLFFNNSSTVNGSPKGTGTKGARRLSTFSPPGMNPKGKIEGLPLTVESAPGISQIDSMAFLKKGNIQGQSNALMDFKIRTALHPLKYYIQKEQAFHRKLKFYGSSIFRKLSIGNNAPVFRTIMKRGFYYYKRNLRLKRTENLASLRRGLRKNFRNPKKLVKNKNSILSFSSEKQMSPEGKEPKGDSPDWSKIVPRSEKLNSSFDKKTILTPPTHFYSNEGKNVDRYRYQIYKDLLQHWYYTPFNRLLLRFDIDAFMNRQPKSHFLTKKEEQLLHLRRNLLGEHYDTLRWYTFMEHYRSMKNHIGGTKSFSSRTYNQQFQGTFKKIRHLFAITPSQTKNLSKSYFGMNLKTNNINSKIKNSNQTPVILKFDQSLYNEYENSSNSLSTPWTDFNEVSSNVNQTNSSNILDVKKIKKKSGSILEKSIFHEELLVPLKENDSFYLSPNELWKTKQNTISNEKFNDLITKSTSIVGNFLLKSEPIRKEFITKFIQENKYSELLKFVYLGQKTKETALMLNQKQELNKPSTVEKIFSREVNTPNFKGDSLFQRELWVQFLKQSKKRLNDRIFIKNYINYRINKREKRISQKQKKLKNRLEKIKTWLIPSTLLNSYTYKNLKELNSNIILTRGLDKTLKKGTLIQKTNPTSFFEVNEQSYLNEGISKQMSTLRSQKNILDSDLRTEQKIKVSLQAMKRVFDKNKNNGVISIANFSLDSKKNLKILASKTKTTLNALKRNFEEKSKPFYFFLKERPNRIKENFWKKRQKVKLKTQKQRKRIKEKSIPEQYQKFTSQKVKNNIVSYQNWVLQEFPSSHKLNQKTVNESFDFALKSSLTGEGYQKLIPRFKESNSINVFKNFINKQLKNKHFVSPNYKTIMQKGKRLEYFPRYFYYYSSNKLKKIKWLNKQLLEDKTINMSKDKKLRVLKNGGFIYSLISKIGLTSGNSDSVNDRMNNIDSKQKNLGNFELTWLKTDLTKKNHSKKRKRRKRQFSIRTKYIKAIIARSKVHKRNIHRKGKLIKFGKQLKHIKANIQLQLWWWQTFLPKFQLAFETVPQRGQARWLPPYPLVPSGEGTKGKLEGVVSRGENQVSSVLKKNYNNEGLTPINQNINNLLVGNVDFKPLSQILNKDNQYTYGQYLETARVPAGVGSNNSTKSNESTSSSINLLNKIYENILINNINNIDANALLNSMTLYPEGVNTNPLPFYAGWDETSRKLVITNRLISRRDAGFNFQNLNEFNTLKPLTKISNQNDLIFNLSPIFGINQVAFLYWNNELPFKTYDNEKYNTSLISFYAPLGWRRFEFRHSILNRWLNFVKLNKKNSTELLQSKVLGSGDPLLKTNLNLPLKIKKTKSFKNFINSNDPSNGIVDSNSLIQKIDKEEKRTSQKFRHRRIKKLNKRSRIAPSTFVFKPQGPLLTDILPSHYLGVFNSQYRLPRHRYLKYKFIKKSKSTFAKSKGPIGIKSITEYNNFIKENNSISGENTIPSFTLRKRSKPKRKFHRKRLIKSGGLIFPRRRKFITKQEDLIQFNQVGPVGNTQRQSNLDYEKSKFLSRRWRPSSESELKLNQPKTKVKTDTIRRRKLRRKMFKQVYKPIQRFQPRYGGFTWPGDYLRLEGTSLAKLKIEKKDNQSKGLIQRKRISKEKRRLGMVGDVPHKYLFKKHNIIVLKKKLEKAQRSNKIRERALELKKEIY